MSFDVGSARLEVRDGPLVSHVGLSSQSHHSLTLNQAAKGSVGQIAAQLYERKCAERGVGINPSYRERLFEMGRGSDENGQGPSLNFSGLSLDASFEIVLDLLLMSSSSDVASLNCSSMGLKNEHIEPLANTLLRCPSVRAISLAGNRGITDEGGEQLLVFLKQRRVRGIPIRCLETSGTGIGRTITQAIQSELPNVSNVRPRGHNFEGGVLFQESTVMAQPGSDQGLGIPDNFTARAGLVAQLFFGSIHRILCVLCWEPPLRSLTWFSLSISLCLSGLSVETLSFVLMLILWHRGPISPAWGLGTLGDSVGRYIRSSEARRHNFFVEWKQDIADSILIPLRSRNKRVVRGALSSSFCAIESVMLFLRSKEFRRWILAGGLIVVFSRALLFSLSTMGALSSAFIFLWTPLWCPLFNQMEAHFKMFLPRIQLSFAILRGDDFPRKLDLNPETGLSQTVPQMNYFVVRLESLDVGPSYKSSTEMDEQRRRLPFNPTIRVEFEGERWLSPQLLYDSKRYEWADDGITTPFHLSSCDGGALTFVLLGDSSGLGGLEGLAKGHVILDKRFSSFLTNSDSDDTFGLKVQLVPMRQDGSLVTDLLHSILMHEEVERERFNVPLQGGPQDFCSRTASGSRLPPMTLFIRIRKVSQCQFNVQRTDSVRDRCSPSGLVSTPLGVELRASRK